MAEGDLIVAIQWLTGNDNTGGTNTPKDNLGSVYSPVSTTFTYIGGTYDCSGGSGTITPCPPSIDPVLAGAQPTVGLGFVYYAVAAKAGPLDVTFSWENALDTVPGYVVYVLHGKTFNSYFYYPHAAGTTATGNSASITASGLANVTYHYALLVAYVSNNPSLLKVPSISAQGFNKVLTWGDSCLNVCSPAVATLSDALYVGYKYSPNDFTFNLQFSYAGTTLYGYAIMIV